MSYDPEEAAHTLSPVPSTHLVRTPLASPNKRGPRYHGFSDTNAAGEVVGVGIVHLGLGTVLSRLG